MIVTGRKHLAVLIQLAVLAGWISFAFAVPAHAADATAPAFEKARANSEQAVAKLERMRAQIDRETLSLDNKAAALDYDPEAAIRYVGSDIGFLPYAGSMRGEIGTMATGSGSALDQALLLGGLLDIMGLDVALAFGELPEAEVERLMRSVDGVKAPESAVDGAAISRIAEQGGTPNNPGAEVSDLDLDQTQSALMTSLADVPAKTDGTLVAALRTDLRENYVWVLHRSSPAEEWTAVHPTFGNGRTPKVTAERYAAVAVPDGRAHAMSAEILVEVTTNRRARLQSLMRTAMIPTAELADRQMDIALVPMGLNPADLSGVQTFTYAQPMLNGRVVDAARAVSPRGETVNASTANNVQSAVASGSLFGDSMRDLDGTAKAPHITAILLKTTYTSPLGKTERRRVLRDFSSSKPGDALSATDIMLSVVIDTNIGETDDARVVDRQLDDLSGTFRHLPYQLALVEDGALLDDYMQDPDLLAQAPQSRWPAMALAQSVFTPTRFKGGVVLPTTAQVSVLTRTVQGGTDRERPPNLVEVMDLMFTDAVVMKDGRADAAATRALGIHRTLHESLLLRGELQGNPLYGRNAKLEPLTSKRAVEAFAKDRKLPAALTERLLDDVAQSGQVLVATQDIEDLHWWKVDRATGEALGMSVHGGATGTDYAVVLQQAANFTMSAAFTLNGMFSCLGDLAKDQAEGKMDRPTQIDKYKFCMGKRAAMTVGGKLTGKLLTAKMDSLEKFNVLTALGLLSFNVGKQINYPG